MFALHDILLHAASSVPDRCAIVFEGTTRTYGEVAERARRLAGGLAARGIGPGDRVALWTSNCAEFMEIIFGVAYLGATTVPLDHWWKAADALAALAQAKPRVLIVGHSQAAQITGAGADFGSIGIEAVLAMEPSPSNDQWLGYEAFVSAAAPWPRPAEVSLDAPALILFTSGSTGRSKGAVHTHRDLTSSAMTIGAEFGIRDGECTLHFLPLFSSCLEHLIPFTLLRSTHVILPSFDAAKVWDAISAHRVTHLNAVPTTLRRLLEALPSRLPASLRLISYASEPMPPSLIGELLERLPDVDFIQIYGMIEHLCVTVQGPDNHRRKPGTVGLPMFGTRLRIQDADGRQLGPNQQGEIFARSPSLFAGYWNDAEATAFVVQDGWMRSGDIGYLDDEGFLVLSGRVKEIIKSGGATIIPGEVEHALLEHEGVREVAVVGIPDTTWGEAVHAFVVRHAGVTLAESELIAFCRSQIAGYKTPKSIHFVEDLPRTGIGKIARREVRENFLRNRPGELLA